MVDSDDSDEAESKPLKRKNPKPTDLPPNFMKPVPHKTAISNIKPTKTRKPSIPSPNLGEKTVDGGGNEDHSSSQSEDLSRSEASSSSQGERPTPTRPKQHSAVPIQTESSNKTSAEEVQVNRSKFNEKISTREGSSSSESDEDSESGSESSESRRGTGSSDQTSLQSPRKRSSGPNSMSNQNSLPYEPPSGFEASSISIHPSSSAAEIFSPANLTSKEVWHITVPGSVPIDSMKEVSMEDFKSKIAILSHKGADYGLVPESGVEQASNWTLLLPSLQENKYAPADTKIVNTLHLQQLVSLPSHTIASATASSRTAVVPAPQKKAPHQQPEGLKMRYHPFGVSDGSDAESTPAIVAKAPQFCIPNAVEAPQAKKRKRSDINSVERSTEVSPIKSKPKKRKTQTEAANVADTAMDIDKIQNAEQKKSERKEKSPKLSNGTPKNAHSPNSVQPEEGQAKRKKEKQKHKHAEPPPAPVSALPTQIAKEAETIMPEEVVDGTSAIDLAHSEDKKAKRREEKRKRKEAAKRAEQHSSKEKQDKSIEDKGHRAKEDEAIQEADSQSREQSVHLPTPKHSSPQKHIAVTNSGSGSFQASNQSDQKKETNEERRKRKEEKRRKRIDSQG